MSEEVKPELLPCPFCACEAWVHSNPKAFSGHPGLRLGHRVECEGICHAMTCWWHDKEHAIKAWNVRAYDPALSAALARVSELEDAINDIHQRAYYEEEPSRNMKRIENIALAVINGKTWRHLLPPPD